MKFNTPSLNQFPPETTANNGDGGALANNGPTAKVDTTSASITTTSGGGSTESQVSDEGEEEIMHTGFLKEWTLMLHGTRDPPYGQLSVRDPHSKLAIVKKAHTIAGPETTVSPQQQSAY